MKTAEDMAPRAAKTAAEDAEPRAWYPLVLIFVVLALGILAGGIFSYRNYERRFRTGIEEQLSAITELKAAQIVRWRRVRLADATFVRRTPHIARSALDVLAQPASMTTRQMFISWLEALLASLSYEQVLVLDERLNLGLAYPEGASGVLGDVTLQAAREALRSRQVVVADLHRETENGPVYLSFMVPLVVRNESTGDKVPAAGTGSSANERSAGLLILQINVQKDLYPLVQQWPTPSRTAETLLVRRDGSDVLFLNDLKYQTNTALKLRISLASTNMTAVKAALGQEGIAEGIDYRGEPVLACLRAIPDSPWSMVARMDLAEVYAPMRERLWLTVLLMGALLLGAGGSVGLVWRHQRVRFYRERAVAAETIRASEERFRRAVMDAPFPILLHAEDGAIIQANNSWCEITGYTPEELATIEDWTKRAYGERKALVQADIDALYSLGHRKCEGDRVIRTKSGAVRIWEFSSAPLGRLPDGRRLVISMAMDVTERRQGEEKLQETNEYLENLFNYANAPIIVWDTQFRITRFNHAFESLTGRRADEVIGNPLELLFPAALAESSMALIKKTTGGERWETVEISILHLDGSVRTVLWNSAAVFAVDGKTPVAAIAQGQDITALRQAEAAMRELNAVLERRVQDRTAQLEASNKDLESFSYSVSHDLRAPLRAIDGYARMLEEDCGARLDDEGRRMLGVICGEAKRMGQLIDDLLSFSRMNRQQVDAAPIDMTALAQAVFEEHAAQAPGRQLQFRLQPLPPTQGDCAMLRQALANLCSNAIKYTRPRAVAEIEMGGRTEGAENLYYVKDNGVGFDMKYARKLFGVFQRLHTEDEFEGTGVGLALVQRVIRRHGGRVWAEAKLNEGATFYFTLPKRKDGT